MINGEDPPDLKYTYANPTVHQKKAKYLELAAEGLNHLFQLTSKGLEKFKDYVAECQAVLAVLKRGPEWNHSQDKVDKFLQEFLICSDQLKKLFNSSEWLLETAEELLDEPDAVDLNQVRNVLSGIYFTIYSISNQLPMKLFVDVAYSVFKWNWTIQLLPNELGQLTWFEKPNPDVQIRGRFGILRERREQIESGGQAGAPSQLQGGEAPEQGPGDGGTQEIAAEPVYFGGRPLSIVHYSVFNYLRKLNNKLIFARRQILLVIQLFFRKIYQQQEYIWPIKDDGEQFDFANAEKDSNLDDWKEYGIKIGSEYIDKMIREEQDKPSQMPAPKLTNMAQEMAKFLEVAVVGLDYLVGLKPEWDDLFITYLPDCQDKIRTLKEGSPERKMKQKALDTLVERINELATHVREVRDQWKDQLLEIAEKLFEQSEVDPYKVLVALSRIYFQLHPLAEQVPMTEFRDVASKIFSWKFKKNRRKDKSGKWTYFKIPIYTVNIQGELGVLWDRIRERRAREGVGGAQS